MHLNCYRFLKESIPNLRIFMEVKEGINIFNNDSDHVVTDGLTQRWNFLLSKLVFAISKKSHPIAIVFEDVHFADIDALGETTSTILRQKPF